MSLASLHVLIFCQQLYLDNFRIDIHRVKDELNHIDKILVADVIAHEVPYGSRHLKYFNNLKDDCVSYKPNQKYIMIVEIGELNSNQNDEDQVHQLECSDFKLILVPLVVNYELRI